MEEEYPPIKFYGIGLTRGVNRNNLTLFRGNKQNVLVIRREGFKIKPKVYNYSNECHKPTIIKFFGFVSGIIHPNYEYQNMY